LLATKAKASTPTPTTSVVLQASKNQAGLCFWSYSADQNKSSGPSLFHEISFPLLPSSSVHSQKTPTKLRQRSPHLKIQAPPADKCVCACACVSLSLSLDLSLCLTKPKSRITTEELLSISSLCLCVCVWNFLCGILRVNSLHSRGNKDLCICRGRAAL
jgi:hypothetical protein